MGSDYDTGRRKVLTLDEALQRMRGRALWEFSAEEFRAVWEPMNAAIGRCFHASAQECEQVLEEAVARHRERLAVLAEAERICTEAWLDRPTQ